MKIPVAQQLLNTVAAPLGANNHVMKKKITIGSSSSHFSVIEITE